MIQSITPSQNPFRFALYARISKDRIGAGLGVERQLDDCRELVERMGGTIVATFTDNDISAYSGTRRPGYEQLLDALRGSRIDAVAVWHQDRLLRRPRDLETYIAVCEPHSIPTYTVRAGTLDLSTPAGRAVARTLAAWASYEVETSTGRVQAAKLQAARAGKPSGGNRGYGYTQDGMSFVPEERAILLELAQRLIDGETYNVLAADLNRRKIPTAKGNQWRSINVRNVLASRRNIAIRVHNDQEYPAIWPRMFDEETWQQLTVAMAKRRELYKQRGPGRTHLLSGFIYCGVCGEYLSSGSKAQRRGGYLPYFSCIIRDQLKRSQGRTGCGAVSRMMEPIDELIKEAIIYRLDSDQMGRLLNPSPEQADEMKRALRERDQQQARLNEILERYSAGDLSFSEYKAAHAMATERLAKLATTVEQMSQQATVGLVSPGQTIRDAWESHDIGWRRQLIDLLIERIIVHPKPSVEGYRAPRQADGRRFDPDLIEVRWRH